MKPADLRPGHRIPLPPPSYAPTRRESIVVSTEPEFAYDPGHERIIVGVELDVDAIDWIGPGECWSAGTLSALRAWRKDRDGIGCGSCPPPT